MASNSQIDFWNTLTALKRDAIYFDLYHAETQKTEWRLTVFGAVAGSSAIGGWLIWKEVPLLWAVVLGLGQVYTVLKPYLPYGMRLSGLATLSSDVNGLALAAEEQWYYVANGLLTDEEVHKQTMTLKWKRQKAADNAFPKTSLPQNEKLRKRADEDARAYLEAVAGH